MNRVLVTGGAGFIGSWVVRGFVAAGHDVVTLDMLTYASHVESLGKALEAPNHSLEVADIRMCVTGSMSKTTHAPWS